MWDWAVNWEFVLAADDRAKVAQLLLWPLNAGRVGAVRGTVDAWSG